MPQILVFGASITQGLWDKEGGWGNRLRKYLDRLYLSGKLKEDWDVFNLGIAGNTTEDLLQRIEFETKQRILSGIALTVISIGLNDCQWINDKKTYRVSPQKFKENIIKIFKIAKKYSKNVVFLGLTPVDESKVDPIPWASERSYKNKLIKKYNGLVQTICKDYNVSFVDVFNKWMEIDYKKLLEDGVHPNSEGHSLIYSLIKDFLISNHLVP
ncbi:hypothetical protein A2774_00140 [Candidatus Roizmanbacteria bacterium RIFCSPHIGHO2_01_FULL_39_12c]|uniref:SGNH hydrolase-type esterase domain-containing protein n=1 Tax=Candidatus Roizmanbacteria bacterium RIFCSPHIGHO2_01_FULL_39_12c TaxID=1802031 RepID=A0A1F7GCZ8_9BACT|nr:MAG: hypothetical protein A2774_00140 [Candidatus Roizmanbacteria bacterium RIFCSPHIGHO2_01_FULL_39_12c]